MALSLSDNIAAARQAVQDAINRLDEGYLDRALSLLEAAQQQVAEQQRESMYPVADKALDIAVADAIARQAERTDEAEAFHREEARVAREDRRAMIFHLGMLRRQNDRFNAEAIDDVRRHNESEERRHKELIAVLDQIAQNTEHVCDEQNPYLADVDRHQPDDGHQHAYIWPFCVHCGTTMNNVRFTTLDGQPATLSDNEVADGA